MIVVLYSIVVYQSSIVNLFLTIVSKLHYMSITYRGQIQKWNPRHIAPFFNDDRDEKLIVCCRECFFSWGDPMDSEQKT
jgi:hypothetical protein